MYIHTGIYIIYIYIYIYIYKVWPMTLAEATPGTWGYQVCALFCGPMVFVQCSSWAARRRLFLMGAQCTDHWRLRLPCLTDARVLFSSLSAPPSIALVLAPLALLGCRQAMLLSLPQPPLCVGTFPLAPHFLHKWVSQSLRLSSWRSFIPYPLLF